jgi:hypothetical protein
MAHAAESTHWYRAENGQPCYEVMGANGQMRPTTLRDARKLNLVPSVTTIIRCADRPGLTNWMVDQGILSALTLPRLQDEPESLWLRRVKEDSKEQAKKAAERGTAIHAAIQRWFEGVMPGGPGDMYDHCVGAEQALHEWLGKGLHCAAEESFAHSLGFGGKVDLHGWKEKGDIAFVVDFKTKEFGPDDDLRTWDEHSMQLAAYREGLQMPKARAAVCYVSVSHPGVARLIEIKPDELERGWQCFKSLLSFWQAKNRYWPEYTKVAA